MTTFSRRDFFKGGAAVVAASMLPFASYTPHQAKPVVYYLFNQIEISQFGNRIPQFSITLPVESSLS